MIIQQNVSLKNYTSFMVEASAKYFVEIKRESDIQKVLETKQWYNSEHIILGQGSNTLFTKDFSGIVLYNALKGIKIIDQDDESVWVEVASGETWDSFVQWSLENRYWGIENLVAIPGTVGAAPVQNIGAYGVEVSDVVYGVSAVDILTGELKEFNKESCNFSYRNSFFKENSGEHFITKVIFSLSKIPAPKIHYGSIQEELENRNISQPSINQIAEVITSIRESKLPKVGEIGMAGSFFENPIISKSHFDELKEKYPFIKYFENTDGSIKIPAGWIIETLGYKGKRFGDVGTYEKHALVIVNYGDATGQEVWSFAERIMNEAFDVFGVDLEPEVNII